MTRHQFLASVALTIGASVGFITLGPALGVGAQSALPGLTDALAHPAPTSGTYAYSTYPGPSLGQTFVDPVFGTTIRRLTNDHGQDDIYARNMWWNADATKYYHRGKIVDTTTGAVTHTVPTGTYNFDAGFDPVDPNVAYYITGNTIHKVVLGAGGAKTDTVWLTVPATINSQGGSENWISADGRILAVSYGTSPAVHVFDTANLAAGPFSGAIPQGSSTGYSAVLPSGRFIVTTSGSGFNGSGTTFYSYAVNLASRSVATTGHAFWNLCGDHAAFISPSDGKDYAITTGCYNTSALMRVDVTANTSTNEATEIASPGNKNLLNVNWYNLHATAVAKGPLRDWAFIDTETGSFPSNALQMELLGVNVLTGEIRRLAHHRSNFSSDYYAQPRVSVSWGGEYVGWASNFQQSTGADIFAVTFGGASSSSGDTTPPTVSVTSPSSGSTLAGTVTVAATASDNVGVVGVQFLLDGATLGAEDMAAPYQTSWTTTGVSDGSHALTARARDAAGKVTTSPVDTVMVANLPPPPPPPADTIWPTAALTAPSANSTVAGTISITASATDDIGVVGVQFQIDGLNLGAEDTAAPYQAAWNTSFATNAVHTITATSRDAAGHTTRSAPTSVTVNNTVTTNGLPLGSIFGDATIFGDARTLTAGNGIEMPVGNAALLREFGASDGVNTLVWRVNGLTTSAVLNGTVVYTGTTSYSTTTLRVQWTGSELQAIRSTTVRWSVPSTGPVRVLASGTLFPALIIK